MKKRMMSARGKVYHCPDCGAEIALGDIDVRSDTMHCRLCGKRHSLKQQIQRDMAKRNLDEPPAGVKVMVRPSVTSLKVTCKGKFRGENLIEGKVTMSDGYWLEGVFEDGILIQGRGKTIDKYRVVYEGEIKNGFPHGKGKCFYNDGTRFEGKFAWGNRMGGTHYSATGEVIRVYE